MITRDPETGDAIFTDMAAPPAIRANHQDVENLAEVVPETDLFAISNQLTEDFSHDEMGSEAARAQSAEFWELLGVSTDGKSDSEYEAADKSSHPLLLTALLRFQAKAMAALLPSDEAAVRVEPVVRAEEIEDEDARKEHEEKTAAERRVIEQFYTEYLFHRLPTYETDTDMILQDCGLYGAGIRKMVVDRTRKMTPVMPQYVKPGDLVISYDATNFSVGRHSHRMDVRSSDLIRRIVSGAYRPVDGITDWDAPDVNAIVAARDEAQGFRPGNFQPTDTHRMIEVYCPLYLDADAHPNGVPRPYIVTIHARTRQVLSIQRNYRPNDPDESAIEHFVVYPYYPGVSALTGMGLGHFLAGTTKALRTAQRRALDAAYLQNHPSGFKLSALSIRESTTKVLPGMFVDIDAPVDDIRAAIMPNVFQGPSPGLLQLAEKMDHLGRELGGIATIDFAELMKSGVAAGPAMAAFDESTEFQTSVHRRLYSAHRRELEMLHDRMKSILGGKTILFADGMKSIPPGTLQNYRVLPMMKPGAATRQRQILEAQSIYELARESPNILDQRSAAEDLIRALGSPDAARLIIPDPEDDEVKPHDVVTEYGMILAGKPVAVGISQNHQAHIAAHAAQIRLIQTSELPMEVGQRALAAIAAHIAEHMAKHLAATVAGQMGISLDQMGPDMPPEAEAQIAPMMAEAVMAIQQQITPATPEETRIQVEQIKAETARAIEEMRQQSRLQAEEMRAQFALLLQQVKDEAAMQREIEDNAAALKIAAMRVSAPSTAGARAAPQSGVSARATTGALAGQTPGDRR
jgi:hypothetical protein